MPDATPDRHSSLRVPDLLRAEFALAADSFGLTASAAHRLLMMWFVRRPGVTMPHRPPRPAPEDVAAWLTARRS